MQGSYALLESLLNEGVDTIFGYPGGAIIPVFDAMYDYYDRLRYILTRHEQGATHAAQGYARVSGKVGVCIVTSGPAATNAVTGISDAMLDSTPFSCNYRTSKCRFIRNRCFSRNRCSKYYPTHH